MNRPFAVLIVLGVHLSAAARADGPFTDVTESSGVAEVVARHYAQVPKWWLSGIDLVDLDGDGDLDLHLAGHGNPAAAAANDGRGRFRYVDPRLSTRRGVGEDGDLPYPGGEIRLAYDFNEDGMLDVLASWHDGGGVLYLGDGRPGAWNFRRPQTFDQFNRSVALADMDRDGVVDCLLHPGDRSGDFLVYPGKPDGMFAAEPRKFPSLAETCPIPVDLDGDGDLDCLLSQRGYNPPGRRILQNDGKLNLTDVTAASGLSPNGGSIHGAGDVDHDGDVDLICVEGGEVAIYLNDGHGRFVRSRDAIGGMDELPSAARPKNTNWGGAVVTDFDNDGQADILVGGRYFVQLLRGDGGGRFTVANQPWGLPTAATSAVDEGLCFGDIDGDGDLDVLTCGPGPEGRQKGVSVFRNDLPARGWLRVRPVGKPGNRAAAGAKIRIYESGGLGDPRRLVWYEQAAIWGRQSFHSYYALPQTERHFGLGPRQTVDVRVEFYPSGKVVDKIDVSRNTVVEVREQ